MDEREHGMRGDRAACQATFEPCPDQRDRPGTHTCAGQLGHALPHECPVCGVFWTRRPTAARGRIVDPPRHAEGHPGALGALRGENL